MNGFSKSNDLSFSNYRSEEETWWVGLLKIAGTLNKDGDKLDIWNIFSEMQIV
jgi:hypothetical protein